MPQSRWRLGSRACQEPRTSLIPGRSGRRLSRSHGASGLRLRGVPQVSTVLHSWLRPVNSRVAAASCTKRFPPHQKKLSIAASYRNTHFRNPTSPELFHRSAQAPSPQAVSSDAPPPRRGLPPLPPPGGRRSSSQENLSGHPACS